MHFIYLFIDRIMSGGASLTLFASTISYVICG